MTEHKIATREEWQRARDELLAREKEHTRMADELARRRRELPWLQVDKEYRFDTEDGSKTLAELFDGRSQLLVYHFMFGPAYEAGCPVCSSIADSINGALPHLNARDATMLCFSRAPLEKLKAYRRRLGWRIPFVSSAGSDFNFDFGVSRSEEETRKGVESWFGENVPAIVRTHAGASGTDVVGYLSEAPAFSAFILQDGVVYQTYSTTARGLEFVMGYYGILDRAPNGRAEGDGAAGWIRRHDEY